jgi:hypothetical protein
MEPSPPIKKLKKRLILKESEPRGRMKTVSQQLILFDLGLFYDSVSPGPLSAINGKKFETGINHFFRPFRLPQNNLFGGNCQP